MLEFILIGVLCVSNLVTGVLFFRKIRLKKEPELTIDATDLLSELIKGGAVIVTGVLDKDQIFKWSPR